MNLNLNKCLLLLYINVTDYIPPDHNGLDNIIMPLLQRVLNNVDIKIGVSNVIYLPFLICNR